MPLMREKRIFSLLVQHLSTNIHLLTVGPAALLSMKTFCSDRRSPCCSLRTSQSELKRLR